MGVDAGFESFPVVSYGVTVERRVLAFLVAGDTVSGFQRHLEQGARVAEKHHSFETSREAAVTLSRDLLPRGRWAVNGLEWPFHRLASPGRVRSLSRHWVGEAELEQVSELWMGPPVASVEAGQVQSSAGSQGARKSKDWDSVHCEGLEEVRVDFRNWSHGSMGIADLLAD